MDQVCKVTRHAIAHFQFIPMVDNGPSTSVRDLFDSFRSASGFLIKLNWPDEAQLASFATRLAKVSLRILFHDVSKACTDTQTFSLSLHSYCQKVEEAFADDMLTDELVQPPVPESKQQAWMEKFKSTLAQLQGEKTIQAFFNFTPTVNHRSLVSCSSADDRVMCKAQQYRSCPTGTRQAISRHASGRSRRVRPVRAYR